MNVYPPMLGRRRPRRSPPILLDHSPVLQNRIPASGPVAHRSLESDHRLYDDVGNEQPNFVAPSFATNEADPQQYYRYQQLKEPPGAITHRPLQSSISMANESLSSTFQLSVYQASPPSTTEPPEPVHTTPQPSEDAESDVVATSMSKPNDAVNNKRKKSKMHQCEVCNKMFPRPSGLKTHMNSHNNLKPFPCAFHGCTRTFTVRSNAKRHLRTHGIDATVRPRATTSPPYVVGFDTPTVVPPPPPPTTEHGMTKVPFKVRWMPLSLVSRKNAHRLRSLSDNDSESDDEHDTVGGRGSSSSSGGEGSGATLSIPLHLPSGQNTSFA